MRIQVWQSSAFDDEKITYKASLGLALDNPCTGPEVIVLYPNTEFSYVWVALGYVL